MRSGPHYKLTPSTTTISNRWSEHDPWQNVRSLSQGTLYSWTSWFHSSSICQHMCLGGLQLLPSYVLVVVPHSVEHNPCDVNDLAPSLWSAFDFMELTQIMRQSNDTAFASLLNKIWTATPQPNSVKNHILQSWEIMFSEITQLYTHDVMHIYARKKICCKTQWENVEQVPRPLVHIHNKRLNQGTKHKTFQHYNAKSISLNG